jgi:glycerol-3-phosphate dehydrogenase
MIDVLIIGLGVVGAAISYELSKYKLSVTALDKLTDVAGEATRANSGIVHAGYDPEPDTDMAKLNVRGAKLIKDLCRKLDVHYKQNGSLVIGFDEADKKTIKTLFERGKQNGISDLEIISGDRARELEPNLSNKIICALNVPSGGIISPWDLAIALAETAARNGVVFKLNTEVVGIEKIGDGSGYSVKTSRGEIKTKMIVNAAGLWADKVHGLLKPCDFKITPSRGQYYLFDKTAGGAVKRTIFQCPNELGKGILVSPTAHGNLLIGPDSENVDCPSNVSTCRLGLQSVLEIAKKSVPNLNIRESIRNFAGVRAISTMKDFIIRESEKNFFDVAGIKSPGLSAAPAIAEKVVELMKNSKVKFSEKEKFVDERRVVKFRHLSREEQKEIIQKNPAYGRMVCRCESITEGEILEAFNSPIPPTTLDAIKRRVHAGMGRCQGGFCSPKIIALIAEKFNIKPSEVLKDRCGSYIVIKEKGEQA